MEPKIVIPILFFLLTVTVLGTALYVYLRQEQKNIASEDKYDKAWNEFYNKGLLGIKSNTPTERSYLLLKTFGFALLVNTIIVDIRYVQPFSVKGFILFFPVAIIFSPLFPLGLSLYIAFLSGLLFLFSQPAHFLESAIFGFSFLFAYLVYPAIFLWGIKAKSRRVFLYIYIALIILLIMNIGGCATLIEPDMFSGLN